MILQSNYFWKDVDGLIQQISSKEKLFIRRHENGHMGKYSVGFERVQDHYSFKDGSEKGDAI